MALLALPELHHHRNAGSATSVFFLFDEGNVEPDARCGRRACAEAREQYQQRESQDVSSHRVTPASADGDDYQDQSDDRENDDDQIAIAERTSRKVGLRFAGARRQLGEFLVVEA